MKYNNEIKLLLSCTQAQSNPKTEEKITKILQQKIDWNYLLKTARKHKMLPLLYWHLDRRGSDIIPINIKDELKQYFHNNIQRNQLLIQELCQLMSLFEHQYIAIIPYKGPILALFTHGNWQLRHWWDLDFIVDEKDFTNLRKILLSQGYQSEHQQEWEASFMTIKNQQKIKLDIHFRITPEYFPIKFNFLYFWQNSQAIYLKKLDSGNFNQDIYLLTNDLNLSAPKHLKIPFFSPEDILILLCIQVIKDTWERRNRLIKICDIQELIISRQDWDWPKIIELSRSLNCERLVGFSLFLTDSLLGKTIPDFLREKLQKDSVITWYSNQAKKQLFTENIKLEQNKDIRTLFLERLIIKPPPLTEFYTGYMLKEFVHLSLKKILSISKGK